MAASMSVRPAFSVEMLIDTIKQHPILYDKTHLNFKDIACKEQLWDKIGKEMGVSGKYNRYFTRADAVVRQDFPIASAVFVHIILRQTSANILPAPLLAPIPCMLSSCAVRMPAQACTRDTGGTARVAQCYNRNFCATTVSVKCF